MGRVEGLPSAARRGARTWLWLLFALLLSAATGVLVAGHYTTKLMEQAQTSGGVLTRLGKQLHRFKTEYAKLQLELQTLNADRDNLIAQTKRLMGENTRMADERGALEQTLTQTARERRDSQQALASLQQADDQLQRGYAHALEERETMQQQLAVFQQHTQKSREQQLKDELAKIQRAHQEAVKALAEARARLNNASAAHAKTQTTLTQLQGRFTELQEAHAKILSQHMELKHQAKRVPSDVTRLAREHERMLKDTADMHYNLGVLLTKNKQYPQAVAEFQKVVELRPEDGDAHYNLGVIYAEHLPDRERVMENFRRYLQLKPGADDATWVKQYIASWQAWEGKDRLE